VTSGRRAFFPVFVRHFDASCIAGAIRPDFFKVSCMAPSMAILQRFARNLLAGTACSSSAIGTLPLRKPYRDFGPALSASFSLTWASQLAAVTVMA